MKKTIIGLFCLMLFYGTTYADARQFQILQKTAEGGDAAARNKLGVFYEIGLGVEQDYREALKWFRLSAGQGYAEAQLNLGQMYEDGRGVTKNTGTALEWYKKACDNGLECGCRRYRLLSGQSAGDTSRSE